MFKKLLIVLAIIGAVACQESVPEQAAEVAETPAKQKNHIGQNLLDLAFIAEKGAKRTIDESQPAFKGIKKGLGHKMKEIAENPHIKGALEKSEQLRKDVNGRIDSLVKNEKTQSFLGKIKSNPLIKSAGKHMDELNKKVKPIVDSSKEKINHKVEEAREKHAHLREEHEKRMAAMKEQKESAEAEERIYS